MSTKYRRRKNVASIRKKLCENGTNRWEWLNNAILARLSKLCWESLASVIIIVTVGNDFDSHTTVASNNLKSWNSALTKISSFQRSAGTIQSKKSKCCTALIEIKNRQILRCQFDKRLKNLHNSSDWWKRIFTTPSAPFAVQGSVFQLIKP